MMWSAEIDGLKINDIFLWKEIMQTICALMTASGLPDRSSIKGRSARLAGEAFCHGMCKAVEVPQKDFMNFLYHATPTVLDLGDSKFVHIR
jgi:hypothetical protein